MTTTNTAGGRLGHLAGRLRRARGPAIVSGVLALALILSACGAGSAPGVPLGPDGQPDATLEVGRTVFGARCSACHGNEGQGGRGKRLNNGRAVELYPDIADMITVITEGKGSGMPSFSDKLTEQERLAVARYIREVLS